MYKRNNFIMTSSLPALLGGKPAFESKVPMVRPVLPKFEDMEEGIRYILSSGMVTRGRYLEAFENAVAGHLGCRHALAVSSCTSGLILSYKGLGLTGEVVVPSFTFMATVSALAWCGLKPVFADVDRLTVTLDPASAEAAITPNTTAIVAVHNFGNPACIQELEAIARRRGLKLIFDAAHGFGALYRGQPVGGQGDSQVFSMSPTKLLITGEGGMVATNDDELASKVRIGREYGNDGKYDSAFPGLNARMPEINALMGLQSLKQLETAALNRNRTAALFRQELGKLPGIGFQEVHPQDRNSYREFSLTIDEPAFGVSRDQLATALAAENIDSRKYYDPPVHRQTAYLPFYDGKPLPNTDWLAANSLSLPMWSKMEDDVVLRICEAFSK
ncbi:MAG: DegT/DnrJ/EryC1/StrS family aminotransferase, partial [Chloroflexota bacterium]